MLTIAVAVGSALSVWWLSTALILYLDRLDRRTFPRSMAAATVVLAGALAAIGRYRHESGAAAAYLAFACGIAVWGWIEMSFLFGYLTGPRRHACASGCHGARHFLHAVEAILWHELAIIALAAAVFALDWRSATHVASATLLTLWLMRASAKLNLFLGVRNSSAELLPPHLAHLRGYFRDRPMNPLFPFSIVTASVALVLQLRRLLVPAASGSELVGGTLVATLIALGILEHLILMLPFSPGALWQLGVRSRQAAG